jgi:acid stress chaperone HdeA
MRKLALIAIGLSVAMANYALADTLPKTATTTATGVKPVKAVKATELTCEEFLSYDEVTRPQIVYWSEGLNGKGKPEDAVIDIDRINSLVPVLVEDCTKDPKSSYWQKIKREFKKVF